MSIEHTNPGLLSMGLEPGKRYWVRQYHERLGEWVSQAEWINEHRGFRGINDKLITHIAYQDEPPEIVPK